MATVSYVLSTNVSPNFTDNLNDLGNGILKVTQFADPVSYASVTIAEAGVDYQAASNNLTSLAAVTPAQGGLIAGTGAAWELLGFGSALVGDVLTITDSGDSGIGWSTPTGGTVDSITFTSTGGTVNITGTNPVVTTGTVNLDIAIVSIAKGGTGQSTATNAFDALSPCTTAGDTIWYNGTHNVRLAAGTTGQVLTITGSGPTTIGWSTNGAGSVTSVAASSSSGVLISGSPITSSGTITINLDGTGVSNAVVQGDMLVGNGAGAYIGLALGTTGQVLTSNGTTAAWSSAPGTGTVTSVAVTSSDLTVGGSPITTAGTITLSLNTVPVAKGGTNFTSYTTGDMIYASGSTALAKLNIGAVHNVLVSTGTAPDWVADSPNAGQVLTFNGSAIIWDDTGSSNVVLTSTSGILITGSGSDTLTVNLDGTGVSNAVAVGDILVGTTGSPNTYQAIAIGTSGQVLRVSAGGTAEWASVAGTGTVTSVAATSTDITITGSPITASGTLDFTLNTVTTAKGGTGLTTYTAGDTVYYAAGTLLSKLAIGAANTVMTSSGTAPQWVGGTAASGNVLTFNGTNVVWTAPATAGTVTSVGVSSSTGLIIASSPITSAGTITANLPGTGVSSAVEVGDLLLGESGSYAGLAIGTTGKILTSNGTTASWASPATSGTVTSVALSSPNTNAILGGTNPITTSGTISINIGTSIYTNAAAGFSQLTMGTGSTLPAGNQRLYIINGLGMPSGVVGSDPSECTAFGYGALSATTTGSGNSAFGSQSLINLTTGNFNTAVGYFTLLEATTSGSMTAIGGSALRYISTGGSNCTALGTNAGTVGISQGVTSYTNNTFLGGSATIDTTSTTATYRTAVGALCIVADDHLVQLGHQDAVGIGLYGSAAPSSFSTGGDTYAGFSVINPTGSVYQLALSGRSGISGLSGLIPIMTSSNANAVGTLLLGNGTNYAPLTIGTNNQVLTSNGTTASWQNASSSAFTWNTVAGTTQTLAANNGYICTNAGQTTATLPATASVGDTYEISAYTAAGWTLLPGTTTQIMRIGNAATTASTGSLTSTQLGDTLRIVCMNADTPGSEVFVVTSSMGNITVV